MFEGSLTMSGSLSSIIRRLNSSSSSSSQNSIWGGAAPHLAQGQLISHLPAKEIWHSMINIEFEIAGSNERECEWYNAHLCFFEVVKEPNANFLFRGTSSIVAECFLGVLTLFLCFGSGATSPSLSSFRSTISHFLFFSKTNGSLTNMEGTCTTLRVALSRLFTKPRILWMDLFH